MGRKVPFVFHFTCGSIGLFPVVSVRPVLQSVVLQTRCHLFLTLYERLNLSDWLDSFSGAR